MNEQLPSITAGDGVRIAYRMDGGRQAGAGAVQLHRHHLQMWDGQIPALTRHFRVLRYDTRGHGGSGVPPAPIPTTGSAAT
jgi:3-oxoadipate enol-lactonase